MNLTLGLCPTPRQKGAGRSQCRQIPGFPSWAENRVLIPSPGGPKEVVQLYLAFFISGDLEMFFNVRVWFKEQGNLQSLKKLFSVVWPVDQPYVLDRQTEIFICSFFFFLFLCLTRGIQ